MCLALRRHGGFSINAALLITLPTRTYSRAATYRRIHQVLQDGRQAAERSATLNLRALPIKIPRFQTPLLCSPLPQPVPRSFSTRSPLFAAQEKPGEIKDQPRDQKATDQEAKPSSGESAESESKNSDEESKQKEEAAPPPPPPPHGDKTPWQVFTDTLRKEFKASKEWNESTKALSSSAHQFTESESVRKARAAYSAASDAASSTTSNVLKNTGKAIGHGAAWTWDTSVVKGVRKGAKVVGKGIDTATKPVRETAAFKSVKDVIDDGSSSRYGGWVEKEERRKARELRAQAEAKGGKRRMEKMEEDPK